MGKFKVVSEYTPSGDQPQAIDTLAGGIENGLRDQVLLGVTGSGKTYTMAKVIERVQRPTLVLAHNKTLAAQLCEEFRAFFPENAVEYFVSYYDYYQPEAYIPHTDTFIEKDAAINDEIERLRHSATAALFERRDVIVVSSVSCIYGLGDPIDYANMVISLRQGKEYPRDQLLRKLVEIRYERNDIAFDRNMFRVRGDTVEIYPVYANGYAIRVEFFGDEIDRISEINVVTGAPIRTLSHVAIYPASHYVTTHEKMERAIGENIASLVKDGDCLQLGTGAIPDAVLLFLKDKKDLGIHSEMFSDGVVELVEAGVITNAKKNIHKGKSVATFLMGTRRLYDYVDNNPEVAMMPVDYVNDPRVICQNDNLVSINSCVQVDLMGQVVSTCVGLRQISGVGGQVDFVRGANMSRGGRTIMAMPSTAAKGTISKIVPLIDEGAAVTTSRYDVNYVVTEYGIAQLKGKTLRERARELIKIAHPDFREGLIKVYEERFHAKF